MNEQNITDQKSSDLPALVSALSNDQLVDVTSFSQEQLQRVDEIAVSVDFDDTNTILMFAAAPQKKMSEFMDVLLEDVRAEDVGVAGDLAVELSNGIDSLELQKLKNQIEGNGLLGSIPLIGPWLQRTMGAAKYFYSRKEKVLEQIERVALKAEDRKRDLMQNNVRLDTLVQNVENHIDELEVWIAGGEKALLRGRDEFEEKKRNIDPSDSLEATKLLDFSNQINAFETRLLRLKAFYTESIISIPQVRATQQAGRIEIQNIFDSMLFDLPRFKNALIRVDALMKTHKAQMENQKRHEAAEKVAQVGADMLDQVYTSAKQSQGSITSEVDGLVEVSNKLLDTLRKGMDIDKENAKKRAEASEKLAHAKHVLTETMKDIQLP